LTFVPSAEAKFRGPVRFSDGAKGMAQQDFECIDEPRFGYTWRREHRKDHGRQFYTVDGREVFSFDEAAKLLAQPPDPESPNELLRRHIDEFSFSPRVGGATRALSEARCNADAGPFATMRAWMRRADSAWHGGINTLSDTAHRSGAPWPSWLYHVKSAAHEVGRLMYLFAADRDNDQDLRCALGTRCRECPILKQIEDSMIAASKRDRFPAEIEDVDIDAAKSWTCVGHILTTGHEQVIDGVFVSNKRDRESHW
jgi:hypothetical protein